MKFTVTRMDGTEQEVEADSWQIDDKDNLRFLTKQTVSTFFRDGAYASFVADLPSEG